MRLDLHNHTVPAIQSPMAAFFKEKTILAWKDVFLQAIQEHHLDGIAITDFQEIEVAQDLALEYPEHTIVGAEYQVIIGKGSSAQIVVLNLTSAFHEKLMKARLRSLDHFISIAQENQLPYFLVHLGWGIPSRHPRAAEILESVLSRSQAIEVANIHEEEDSHFARDLAQYYGLATIGGSHHLLTHTTCRAYTQCDQAKNKQEFFTAIQEKKVEASISSLSHEGKRKRYLEKMKKLWHSEWGWHREEIKDIGKSFLFSFLEWLPYHYHTQQRKSYRKKVSVLQERFIEYLILKETRRIVSMDLSIEEKKEMWQKSMQKIFSCFGKVL